MSSMQQALAGIGGTSIVAPTFRAVGTAGTSTNPTVALPAGHTAGDLLVIAFAGGGADCTTPAGWTQSLVSSGTAPRLATYYKIDGGSESNVSISGGSTTTIAVMLAYSGCPASPSDVTGTVNIVTATSVATNTLTTTQANDLVISMFTSNTSAATWTPPASGTTTRYDSAGTASRCALLVVDETKTAAGVTTARSATASGASANMHSMALSYKGT